MKRGSPQAKNHSTIGCLQKQAKVHVHVAATLIDPRNGEPTYMPESDWTAWLPLLVPFQFGYAAVILVD